MKVSYTCLLWLMLGGAALATDWLDEHGINVLNVGQEGDGAFIGQLELSRPGKTGIDHVATINVHVQPDAIFTVDQAPTPLPGPSTANTHAVQVAGIMIASNQNLPGVAPSPHLSSAEIPHPTVLLAEFFTLALQNLSKQPSMSAINLSFGVGLGDPNGNTPHTLAFDWNATRWNILNVAAGNFGSTNRATSFQDNFNGMTVGYSEKVGNTWRQTGDNMYFGNDAQGASRTSLDLIAPGRNLTLHDPGDPATTSTGTGTSLATPLVTGTAALLRGFASQKVGGADERWNREVTVDNFNIPNNAPWTGPAAYRHELMKAVLMNSADKLRDDGTVQYPGTSNDIPEGYLLGMSRTVVTEDNHNWFDSAAFPGNQPHQIFPHLVPLEMELGAGHLNAMRAFDQFKAGGYEHNQNVPMRAWAVGETSSGANSTRRYHLEDSVPDGSFVSITLAWDRYVEHNDNNGNFEFEPGESFDGWTDPFGLADDVISSQFLYLVPRGGDSNSAVAKSECPDCTIQHIFQNVP